MGLLAGALAVRLIGLSNEHVVELTISAAAAYGTYLLAEELHQSGIIATVVAGVVIGTYGRTAGLSRRALEALDIVWELVAFLLTAIAFLLVGIAISAGDLVAAAPWVAWGLVGVVVGRAVVVYGLLGGTARLLSRRDPGSAVPMGWLHVLFWAGLRGAVAVAMALALPETSRSAISSSRSRSGSSSSRWWCRVRRRGGWSRGQACASPASRRRPPRATTSRGPPRHGRRSARRGRASQMRSPARTSPTARSRGTTCQP